MPAATAMTLPQRLNSWQAAADHHAPEYFWLALKVAPFLIQKRPRIIKARAVQTWLEFTATGTEVRVTYKRHRPLDSRIEITIRGTNYYFGPRDLAAIKALLSPL